VSATSEPQAASPSEAADTRPKLLFFYTDSSGRCRRAEGYLAQVLQRRRNHDTFKLYRIDCSARADLAERFGIGEAPTLVVVDDKQVCVRLEQPRGSVEIQEALAPWLH
jgi:thioredoxin-like negative regulator of GroEL